MCGTCGCDQVGQVIDVEQAILGENDRLAKRVREHLDKHRIAAFNWMSSPGSGKTSLLIQTIAHLNQHEHDVIVIEGDQHTDRDAKRIEAIAPVSQINTGKGCHLDAHAILHALDHLPMKEQAMLFIENVGNLVCPAAFDLGEHFRVVVLSVTEGDDKPLKYPYMFHQADAVLFNKIDLLPYVDFDINQSMHYIKQINPKAAFFQVSAKTNAGMADWCQWMSQISDEAFPF